MILPYTVLVILFSGGADGGRFVSTDLKFSNLATCETAAERIRPLLAHNTMNIKTATGAVCVEVR